mmetsp:Transcript_8986/g.16895  ORF Transcript_8986/g.16895 Transcript_8986/m.16895 type:complete len:118 (-) Transcript_8986:127-480(-)
MAELPRSNAATLSSVETIDGHVGLSSSAARDLARKMFGFGFFALPWMWLVNVWFFWPQINSDDLVLRKYVRGSAIGFVLFSAILLPWTIAFLIAGKDLVGTELWHQLSISRLSGNQL